METPTTTPAEPVKPMPLLDRLTNVFASPGELFENVRQTEKTSSNWLIPLITMIVVSLVLSQMVFSNASLVDQMGTMIKKSMEKSVQQGKMTQEQADQTYETYAKPGTTMSTMFRVGGTVIGIPIAFLVITLVYWLLGKWTMKATAPYMKVGEVVGLVFFIGILEAIVTTLMMFLMDSIFASPSLAVFISGFDIDNKLHVALSKVNVFTIWSLAVTSIGLSKLFQRDLSKVLVLVFALWILWCVLSILTGVRLG